MLAKIKYEKVVGGDGILRLKVTGWDGVLAKDELPKKYLQGNPHFYELYDKIIIHDEKGKEEWIFVGDTYTTDRFARLIRVLKRAGERLTEINKELNELRATWHGEGEVII